MMSLVSSISQGKSSLVLAVAGTTTAIMAPMSSTEIMDAILFSINTSGGLVLFSTKSVIALVGFSVTILVALKTLGIYGLIKKIVGGTGSLIKSFCVKSQREREQKKEDDEIDDWLMHPGVCVLPERKESHRYH